MGRLRNTSVDIATEWNLKINPQIHCKTSIYVDIATEWNLKEYARYANSAIGVSRYSNRMEFKVSSRSNS